MLGTAKIRWFLIGVVTLLPSLLKLVKTGLNWFNMVQTVLKWFKLIQFSSGLLKHEKMVQTRCEKNKIE